MSAVTDVMAELALLEDPKLRAANEARGDDHGVNLSAIRAVAKPTAFSADELDAMIRGIRAPKLLDWFVTGIVKPGTHTEALRLRWKDEADLVGRAGWSLTTDRVVKGAAGLDLDGLLHQIETEMKDAPAPKQWSMNHCLAEIGIRHPAHRARAIAIGERLQVLVDYPASPGCTPPYAPVWIAEMVRRQEGSA